MNPRRTVPSSDVVVIGAGLAGMTAAIALADAGARVDVIARGHAATHWTSGGLDVAAPPGSATADEGITRLASKPGHPYAFLGRDVGPAIAWVRGILAAEGLIYLGDLDEPLRPVPTAIGGTRRAGTLPAAQAAALRPWRPDERLVVCGPAGFKDFWPSAIAASLERPSVWGRSLRARDRPASVEGLVVELPDIAGRRNLTALHLARLFDDSSWRAEALAAIAAALHGHGGAPGRVALPAVLGLADHAAAFDDASRSLPLVPFEVPLISPSVPGLRLFEALRAALRRRGGRISVGEEVVRIETAGRRVTAVAVAAAARERVFRTGGVVLATGGIAGGGLIGRADGTLVEPLLGLPVEAPPVGEWLADEPFDPAGHPLEAAGIRTDGELHPVDGRGKVAYENVAIVGSLLAGQRYLTERCGDGVAVTSGRRAAAMLAAKPAKPTTKPRPESQKAAAAR
jgi:glycerol-3-phosphate dehydrogenase subunit B